jgi:hypothetical protein
MMWTARATTSSATRTAPDFTLTDTTGHPVHLTDFRGHNVVLYFSEGAGCQTCLTQMAAIEQHAAELKGRRRDGNADRDEQRRADPRGHGRRPRHHAVPHRHRWQRLPRLRRPRQGHACHLPGHGFVLIDANGVQRW